MSVAVCDAGHETRWRAQRGAKLADHRCGQCGGVLHARVTNPANRKGRKFMRCEVCGRRKLKLRMATSDWMTYDGKVIPANTMACWHHFERPVAEARAALSTPREET